MSVNPITNRARRARWVGAAATIVVVAWVAASCAGCSVKYVIQAGAGEAKLLMARKSVEKVLADPAVSPDIKEKIKLIQEAKRYGEEHVGLKKSGSYTSYAQIGSDVVSWNLMASPKLALQPVTWWFPIIGKVPYLGYFHVEQGRKKEEQLKKKGYDTYLRGAAAYSTLGWFKDPILSSLMKENKAYLANTVLHELTHTTVFIEGHVAYNEGLATFVGNQASLDFLTAKYGADSKEVHTIQDYIFNDRIYSTFIKELYNELDRLYRSEIKPEEKLTRREKIFDDAVVKFKSLPFRGETYRFLNRESFNNAAVLSRAIYFEDLDMYEGLYKALGNNLPACIRFFLDLEQKVKHKQVEDPEVYTKEFIKAKR